MSLEERMIKYGSFPKGERSESYQEYYYNNKWQNGQRDVVKRAELMEFRPQPNETVLEIGCNTGGFLQYSWLCGSRNVYGIDIDEDYISLAKELNKLNNFNINYSILDITQQNSLTMLPKNPDHLLILSMGKHIGEKRLFEIIDYLKPRTTYIETNATNEKNPYPYLDNIRKYGGYIICETNDRNRRIVYKIKSV